MEIGDRFGRLVFIEDLGTKKYAGSMRRFGIFKCDCGNEKEIICGSVSRGLTTSCGCYQRDIAKEVNTLHGLTNHPLRRVWSHMHDRCYNQNDARYSTYGARGVVICDEWRDNFLVFYNWAINNGWKTGLQIDRIDNDGNYEPSNCQFITRKENCAIGKRSIQSNNTSGYVGVIIEHGKCSSNIVVNKNRIRIGRFADIEDAVEARIAKEIELFGEQKTNFHYDRNNFKKD